MDLTRLYNFTTPELREEAERLGVRDTYAMSRGQLIQAIREQLEPPTARKRGLFGTMVGIAKWAVQAATEAGTGAKAETGTGTESADHGTESVHHGTGPVDHGTESVDHGTESRAGTAAADADAAESVTESGFDDESASEREKALEQSTDSEPRPETAAEPDAGAGSSRPPAGVFANSTGLFEEPIPTRTMARILAEQGHFKRSLAIYAKLLEEEPEDGELAAEVEAVREEAKARRSYAPQ